MSDKSQDEIKAITIKLNRLMAIDAEANKASDESRVANQRWNAARLEYANLHRELEQQHGPQYTPTWLECLRGKRDN